MATESDFLGAGCSQSSWLLLAAAVFAPRKAVVARRYDSEHCLDRQLLVPRCLLFNCSSWLRIFYPPVPAAVIAASSATPAMVFAYLER